MAAGRLHLDELADAIGAHLPEGEYETLGGLAMAQLGRIPSVGDSFVVAGWDVEVAEMDGRRVAMVRMRRDAVAT